MTQALIGYTGFVGSNLARQQSFDALFNSANFREMTDRDFDLLVCAGVSAVKWKANQDPEGDRARIQALRDVLATVRARRFVLISTIDVYPVSADADESYDCGAMGNHAYGSNRLALEEFCGRTFPQCLVVRLPGLFGPGLRKNVLFDLLNDHCLEMINPACSFQYYDLAGLWADIEKVSAAGLKLINLFTEPVETREILARFFPDKSVGEKAGPEMHYRLRTRHDALWGRSDGYMAGKEAVMQGLSNFIAGYSRNGG